MTARSWSRRSALAALALGPTELFLSHWAAAAPTAAALGAPKGELVCVFLRGAADGLNIVVPHGDSEYYRLRPTIAVPRPGKPGGVLDLDGRFGLHPRLAALKPAYDAHQLALVHAVGSPHPTRSHFEAQDYLETGAVGMRSVRQGWLSHYLTLQAPASDAGLRAVALSERTPLALRGYPEAIALRNLRQFRLSAEPALRNVLADGFAQLYAEGSAPALRSGRHALEVADRLRRIARAPYAPDNGASYAPEAQPFADVARLIKADVGLETAWIDLGGWDTHKQQGASEQGELPRRLDQLGKALAAFRADLGPRFQRVLVLVMSEFGRTARENGTGGTDHGHGNVLLLLGGSVHGGRVHGRFPGLAPEQLYEERDLAVTTDYRDVLAEVAERHLGLADASPLFPGYALDTKRRLGLLG